MKNLGLVLALALAACAPFRYYPLPVSTGEARATFAPIATAASDMGLKFWRWDDSVGVQVDPELRVSYMFDASNNYVMCVQLMHKAPPGGVEQTIARGKQVGDEIWRRAMALRPAPVVQIVVPPPDPAVQINVGR